MAKRFTDTEMWDKEWFMLLPCKIKCLVKFVRDKSDLSGVWSPNWIIAKTYIGENVTEDDLLAVDGGNQFKKIDNGKIFCLGFIEFQYGTLSEKSPVHRKIIQILNTHSILYQHPINRVQEEEEEEEEIKEEAERGFGGKQTTGKQPNFKATRNSNAESLERYQVIVEEVKNIADPTQQKTLIADFITTQKPNFPEPYADLWNLSLSRHKIAQVSSLSGGRLKKFSTRLKETEFDFIAILTEINKSDYLKGQKIDWKIDWDWLFENDTNYLKVIEGKYRN